MYELLFTLNRRKGIQAHVFDREEGVIQMLYLDPHTLDPKEEIHPGLKSYLAKMEKVIQEGKYIRNRPA